mgnify:CR=1 FL=1
MKRNGDLLKVNSYEIALGFFSVKHAENFVHFNEINAHTRN